MSYRDIVETVTEQIFAHDNILTDIVTNDCYEIYDGLQLRVNLCVFYEHNSWLPHFLINADELCFPHFEYIIRPPHLGKDDNDTFINKCKEELFILFDDVEPLFSGTGTFVGYMLCNNGTDIYAFFHIPSNNLATITDTSFHHSWALISQIIQHTPLALFHICPQLARDYMNIVVIYGPGKREHNAIFGFFYYFIYDNSLIPSANNGAANNGANKFFLLVKPKRVLDTKRCKDVTKILRTALKYESFLFPSTDVSCCKYMICVKDYTTFFQ